MANATMALAERLQTSMAETLELPDLVEVQLNSYEWFLRAGLRELFDNFSPIEDFTGALSLEFLDYNLGEPKYSAQECRDRDMTYEMPIKVKVRLVNKETGELKESEVYTGELPCMTENGTFVINGAERVVVSQLARSSGVYFDDDLDFTGRVLFKAQIIPREGAWVDLETDSADVIHVKIGQARKFPVTTLLKAFNALPDAMPHGDAEEEISVSSRKFRGRVLAEMVVDPETGEVLAEPGATVTADMARELRRRMRGEKVVVYRRSLQCGTDEEIVRLFATEETLERPEAGDLEGLYTDDAVIADGQIVCGPCAYIDEELAARLATLRLNHLTVLRVSPYIPATLEADGSESSETALLDVHRRLRPGDPPTLDSARKLLSSYFFDKKRYDLARVGRFKVNSKLGLEVPGDVHTLTKEDIIGIIRYIIGLREGRGQTDDIDHLRNKRIRSVGELLQNQLRIGFLRMERVARERMTSLDRETITAQTVISIKPITASIRSFFGSGQLSQFMDQTNPLAELTHKRRLSALGPGGLSRQSAKLEVRDVHRSHYGRICPIETPEGPNIGLISSLASYARVDDHGFIQTPYRVVRDGKVQGEIVYLTAEEEDQHYIAPADAPLTEDNRFQGDRIQVRHAGHHPVVETDQVEYMDVSPMQLFSVATCCIPFLQNDDANRALMGANMQRQAVPLLRPEAPLVKTGIESRAARDSGSLVLSPVAGVVEEVDASRITIRDYDDDLHVFELLNFVRSNQGTCIHHRPRVRPGDRVRPDDVLADGSATDNGELALGKNLLVAFMLWEGFNYEDAIVLSERVARDDVLTSIHIEKHEIEGRDTKLGPEEITRDIPNVGEDMLRKLDANGIVHVGAEVTAEDILVGKVAPKSQGELTAEERLVIAIFGKKAEEMRDASLRMPHGESGIVVDVRVFSRYRYRDPQTGEEFDFINNLDKPVSPITGNPLERVPGDELKPGTNHLVRVYVAQKRKVMEGDKMAGRHGNKGVIARVLPECDMPYLPDGTPVDIVLNPLGVPSRMNIGQILETHLGMVGRVFKLSFPTPIFFGAQESEIFDGLREVQELFQRRALSGYVRELELPVDDGFADLEWADQVENVRRALSDWSREELSALADRIAVPEEDWNPRAVTNTQVTALVNTILRNVTRRCGFDGNTGKSLLYDGRTGEQFHQPVVVGQAYMLKLHHLVEDKIHARSTGPYSLVTQQPLGGKAQFGGQRFGEMEVWALEAYGAAHILQELLTVKSDDVVGRVKTYEAIVKGEPIMEPGMPESFKILVKELQSLGLQVTVETADGESMELRDDDEDMMVEAERRF